MADSSMRDAARAFSLATDFVLSIVVFAAIGYALDAWLDTDPRYLLIGLGLGLVVGSYRFVREALRVSKTATRRAGTDAAPRTQKKDA